MKINTVIFDLDGTLLNTLDDLYESANIVLDSFSFPLKTIDEIRNAVGNGVEKLIERIIPNGKQNPDFNNCLSTFKEVYSKNLYNKTSPYLGIKEMLLKLKKSGYNIAVVSNKFDYAVKELCNNYFSNLIDIAVGENEKLGIKKKPSPDTVFAVLDSFSVKSKNAVYIGDSDVDILTANNSKMPCISVTWGFRDKEFLLNHGAQNIIENPTELIIYLEKINRID